MVLPYPWLFNGYLLNCKVCPAFSATMFNRPGVARAVLQTGMSLIYWLSCSSFSSKPSKQHNSPTIKAGELTFLGNVHPTPCFMCHLSCVTCHLSHVTCHLSHVTCHVCFVLLSLFLLFFFLFLLININIYIFFNKLYPK